MNAVRRFRRFVLALLVVYVAQGVVPKPFRIGQPEWLPFFSWSLFSRVPQRGVELSVRALALDAEPLDPPVPLMRVVEPHRRGQRDRLLMDLWNIHKGVRDDDRMRVERGRRRLEQRLLGDREARYEVRVRSYELLSDDRAGESIRSVGIYERGRGFSPGVTGR